MSRGRFGAPLLHLALLTLPHLADASQQDEVVAARRVADVTALALAEYAEGVVAGRVERLEELNEARLFMDDARRAAALLGPRARAAALPHLELLIEGVATLRPVSALSGHLDDLRRELEAAIGAPLDLLPRSPPSLHRGERLYHRYCAACHGATGAGDGAQAAGLDPPPADLAAAPAQRSASPLAFFRTINVGVAGTAMPGFADALALDQRWAVALYSTSLRHSHRLQADGREVLRRCADCATLFGDFSATASLSDDSLAGLLRASVAGLPDASLAAALAYARVAGAVEELGGDRRLFAMRQARRTRGLLDSAVAAVARGDHAAGLQQVADAYLVFETIETAVRARDASAARRVEQVFARLRAAIQLEAGIATVHETRQAADGALDRALAAMVTRPGPMLLFSQSLLIVLREGLEAILIVGALATVLRKAGASHRRRDLASGVLAAVIASLATAAAFALLFRAAPVHQEALEGITMLVAAAMLFWVSYWLVSKIELRKWQAFVRAQLDRALASRRAWGLAAVGFLAVYREGLETVLFYAALFTSSGGHAAAVAGIVGGMVVGGAALALLYLLIARYGVRLPLRPFFGATSALLYLMAFSFAGQGVAELQEAGLVSATPLEWLPSLPVLGVFPTMQTLVTQAFVAAALAAALTWLFWLGPRTAGVRAALQRVGGERKFSR